MAEEKNTTISKFVKYRSKLKDLYDNDLDVRNRIGSKTNLSGLQKVKTKDAQELFTEAISNPDSAADISLAAYYMSDAYASIINYYKTFFYIRYTVVPKLRDELTETGQLLPDYDKIYYRMINSIEGINFETTLPAIAEEALIKGKCGVITEKHKISDTIVTFFLPVNYFKFVGKTQFGTDIIAFNYKYFDELESMAKGASNNAVEGTDFTKIVESMPKILQDGYKHYLEDKNSYKWQILDPRTATGFSFNELCIPPRLGAFPASVDYNSYKNIKLNSVAQQLDKILVHQIPTNNDGDLIMDVDEALDVAKNMRNALREIPDLKVVTTFGKTDLHQLQTKISDQVDVLDAAYHNIYSSAGVDYHVFVSDRDLEASIRRDKAFMWDFYEKVMLFYNITINQLLNFKPYQAKVNLIPVTLQMEQNEIKEYIGYAGSGIGRLQAVIATGIKQSDLNSAYEVEKFLDFDKILKPLQSMYTSSYRAQEVNKEETNPSDDEETSSKTDISELDGDEEAVEEENS